MRPSRERWRVTRSGLAIAVLFTALAGSATPGDPALFALRERRYADADRNLNELYATRRESRAHAWALDTALERLGLAGTFDAQVFCDPSSSSIETRARPVSTVGSSSMRATPP